MAGLRKANAYSKRKVTPYTRTSKRKNRAYIKTIPPQKIVKFSMGKQGDFEQGKLPYAITLISEEKVQIRHNSLEACRQYLNKKVEKETNGQFFFRVIPYPHHIQRENKMLTGAGADRMQTGMQLSFGKTVGKAAIIKEGAKLFMIAVPTEKNKRFVRELYHEIKPKLPCTTKILQEELTSK